MKFHPGILIAVAIKLGIIALGVFLYLAMPSKASMIRVDRNSRSPYASLTIASLEPDRPFQWETLAGGGRGRDNWMPNSYHASRLRIVCHDDSAVDRVYEPDLPSGSSRLVTIRVEGCNYVEVDSSPLPRL